MLKRKLTALFLSATMLLTGIGAVPAAALAAEGNIALNKPATTSRPDRNNAGMTPSLALDGNAKTRWATGAYLPERHGPTDENWICVDLGGVYDISRVVLNWEAAYAKDYDIQVSNDYTTFTTVYNGTAKGGGIQALDLSGTGRYIRMYANEVYRADYGTSLYEFEVYGTPAENPPESTDVVNVNVQAHNNGWSICSTGTWAAKGGEATVRFMPLENCELQSVLVNGEEKIGDVRQDGTLVCQANEDLQVVPVYRRIPASRFEAESTTVVDENGKVITGSINRDETASGGAYMGQTGGKGFILESTTQANRISVAYSSPNTSTITVYMLLEDKTYEEIGSINFSTTGGWYMDTLKIADSDALYIPEGATIKLVPQMDVNLDYFTLSYGQLYTEETIAANTLLAKNAELTGAALYEDIMAAVGTSVKMEQAGQSVSFTVPDNLGELNVYNLKYKADVPVPVTIGIGNTSRQVTLPATRPHYYESFGEKEIPIASGETFSISLPADAELYLDSLSFNYAKPISRFAVEQMPTGNERLELNMNGIWECTRSSFSKGSAVPQEIPKTFDNSIPVPGFWDQASVAMPNYNNSALWYHTTLTLPEAPQGNAVLRIGKAYYGRYVYVNGVYVGDYQYNYTSSSMDITDLLHEGKNDIVIMLGNYEQQRTDPDCPAHVGTDGERNSYYSGIIDGVTFILNDSPAVTALQTAPNLENGTVKTRTTLNNRTDADVITDVTFNIYELGVFKDGVPTQEKKLVGTHTESNVSVSAGSSMKFDVEAISIAGCTEDKFWTPDNPFLYEMEVITSGDTYTDRFGMRTFHFDAETKLPMLNGKVYYLRGTNVAMNRFYEDPLRADHPFDREWARDVYQQFKDMHWDSLRFHVGFAPDVWYDVADEEGFMIMDEYAVFGHCADGCTMETLSPEMYAWMDEKCNNPSLIIWDIQNEANNLTEYSATIRAVRDYDIQNRPWDNGWTAPQSDTDPSECHPYMFLNNSFTLSDYNTISNTEYKSSGRDPWNNDNPKINNEYGWLWLDRYGDPTSLTKGYYDKWLPGSTREERLEFYAKAVGQSSEFWREGRHYVGLMHFAGLTYSKPNAGGATSDIFMPDINTPTIHPCIKEAFRNAFAPVGVIIKDWSETVRKGTVKELPVTVINDRNEDLDGLEVKLTVLKDGKEILSETKVYNVRAAGDADGGDRQVQTYTVKVPRTDAKLYEVTAEYTLDGETVYSRRTWTIDDSPVSIAQGKEAFANLEETKYPASYVVDGSNGTRWSSYIEGSSAEVLNNAWITIDLGEAYRINKVLLNWEAAYGKKYLIQVSDDNEQYTTIYEGSASGEGEQTFDVSGTGRYLRMQGVERGSSYGYSLFTFDAWGEPVTPRTYAVSVADVTGGTANVTASPAMAKENDSVSISVADVQQGKEVQSVSVTDEDGFDIETIKQEDGTYTFTMPPCSVTVQVILKDSAPASKQVLTVQYGTNATLSVEGAYDALIERDGILGATVYAGDTLTLTFTPANGPFASAQLNGADIPFTADGCTYTFTMPNDKASLRFVFTSVNKSILETLLEKANEVTDKQLAGLVGSVSKRFIAARDNAKAVYEDDSATQEEVNEAWKELLDAMHYLSFEEGTKDELKYWLDYAAELDLDNFTPKSLEGYAEALAYAEEIYNDEGETLKAEVEKAAKNLQEAILRLEFKANTEVLGAFVQQAQEIEIDKYLDGPEKDKFNELFPQAEALLEDANATQKQVDEMADALYKAMMNLRMIPDKEVLKALIDESEALNPNDYTEASYAILRAALNNALDVYEDENATPEEITAVYATVEKARAGLVLNDKPEEPAKPGNKPSNSGSSGSKKPTGNTSGTGTAVAVTNPVVNAAQNVMGQKSVRSDTTANFILKRGSAYCFKMTVMGGGNAAPSFTVGNGNVLKTQFVAKIGNDYYYRVWATGVLGQSTGVYTTMAGENPQQHCVVTIG